MARWRSTKLSSFFAIALSAIVISGASPAPPDFCDARLVAEVQRRNLDEYDRYQPRGRGTESLRCEGSYGQKQAGGDPVLVGVWHACAPPWPTKTSKPSTIRVTWGPGATSTIYTRVQSLAGSRLYRMDGSAPARARAFGWPADVINALRLDRANLMVRSWFNNEGDLVHLPVTWAMDEASNCQRWYYFRFDLVPRSSTNVTLTIESPDTRAPKTFPQLRGSYSVGNAWVRIDEGHFTDGVHKISIKFDGARSANVFKMLPDRS